MFASGNRNLNFIWNLLFVICIYMSNQQLQQEIKIADNIPGAEYANLMHISHNKEEFHLMFSNLMNGSGRVVSKIITNPAHYKRIIMAMNENLKKYEERFGEIKEAELPNQEIGFK